MTEAYRANSTGGASCDDEGAVAALGIAKWLCLAATPTFAIMALMTGVLGGGPMDMLGSSGHGSPLSGMVPMYMLMSAFHSAPWLKLISSRRSGAHRHPATLVTPTVRCPARSLAHDEPGDTPKRATQSRNQRKGDHRNQHFVPAESRFARGMGIGRRALIVCGEALH
jgi:hypothetical protein